MQSKHDIEIQLVRAAGQMIKFPAETMYWQGMHDSLCWVLEKEPTLPPIKPIEPVVNPIKETIKRLT